MDVMIANIFLQALVLCGLLWLIARHEADLDFAKVAMVVAGITLGNFVLQAVLAKHIGLFVIPTQIVFMVWMLCTFCWLRWWKATIVVVLFAAISFGMSVGFALVVKKVDSSVDAAGGTVVEQSEENTREAIKIFREMMDSNK